MMSPLKTTVLAAAVAATTLTSAQTANANPAVAWAIVGGVAAGALLVGALSYPRWHGAYAAPAYSGTQPLYAPAYAGTPPTYGVTYVGTAPLYAPATAATVPSQPRSAGWLSYCESRYRTFDPGTGTFIGADGRRHFCHG
ncbi:BA14K family protein [Pseudaminobacter soli (ex Li et al. 2025)]|uniref:Lectin-like protein BA14k n=1 Tax=Pseudaminobacter soli (ex Li et al. 2025) TaxID=1295366 RepID=A0A2P7S703_9HYPH|nr:BA14K family protein [Mesorhizobium soli]PSJ58220.1 BA14K family protein [Mesorhizobium soli]